MQEIKHPSFDVTNIIQTAFVVTIVPLVLQSGNNVVKSLFDNSINWITHFWNYRANRCVMRYVPYTWENSTCTSELFLAIEEYLNDILHDPNQLSAIKNNHLIFPDVNYLKSTLKFRPKSGTQFRFFIDKNFKILHKHEKNSLEVAICLSTEQKQNGTDQSNDNMNSRHQKDKEEKYYQGKIIGSNDTKQLDSFLSHIIKNYEKKRFNSYRLFVSSVGNSYNVDMTWMNKNCSFDGVLMDDELRRSIRADISLFWDDEKHYNNIAQPHRCSFFLVGKPGSGKTSFIRCLPTEIKHDINVVVLKFPSKSTNMMYDISQIFEKAKNYSNNYGSKKAIWVIEDIDCISSIVEKREIDDAERQKHSAGLSALLNAIDGIETPEHIMIVFTSNHPEMIDPALVRPGRMDKIYNFDHIKDINTLVKYGERFFSDVDSDLLPSLEFYKSLLNHHLTNASIVQILKRYRNYCKINKAACDWKSIISGFIDERTSNNLDQSIFVELPN